MNKEQMLLLKVAEECNELAQICSKSIRFGLNNHKPSNDISNKELLFEEWADLWSAMRYFLSNLPDSLSELNEQNLAIYLPRKERIDKYLQVSKELGIYKD